jgi:uncharacterized protein YgiB involved in biofilm formation
MKRSTYVHLVLLGSAMGLYGCDSIPENLQQQKYTSLDQCRKDWGDPTDCKQGPVTPGHSFMYLGPRYYWDAGAGRPVAVNENGETRSVSNSHVTSEGSHSGGVTSHAAFARGGFGSSAHGFGGGG